MGAFISKNKPLAVGVVVLALLGVAAFGVWNWMSSRRNVAGETAIYEYEQGSLKSFTDKKIEAPGLIKGFDNLAAKLGNYEGLFPIGIETAHQLMESNQNAEALTVLKKLEGTVSNHYQRFVYATNLSVAYENAGQKEEALAALETLVKGNVELMQAKVYLDLGRLALELGQNDKARSNLQWVIDKGSDAEMTLLARLYLSKLEQK